MSCASNDVLGLFSFITDQLQEQLVCNQVVLFVGSKGDLTKRATVSILLPAGTQ